MTHCYNCGHAGTFVLLVQFALAVSGPDARVPSRSGLDHGDYDFCDHVGDVRGREDRCEERSHRRDGSRRGNDPRRDADSRRGNDPRRRGGFDRDGRLEPGDLPTQGGLSLAVQCPACDSTDVGVGSAELLARYRSNTTS